MNCEGDVGIKNRINSIRMTTIVYRIHGLRWDISNPCCLSLCNHSTNNIKQTKMIRRKAIFLNAGMVKMLALQIPHIYSQACPIVSALKIIHPITAKKKVRSICPTSLNEGSHLPSATWFVYLRFFPVKMSGRNNKAW